MSTKLSGLDAAASFVDADIFHLRTAAGVDKKITGANLKDSVAASEIDIADAGGRYTGTEIEAALQEIAGAGRTVETVKANKDAIDAIVGSGVGAILLASQTIDGGVATGKPVWFDGYKEVVDLCDVADWTDDGAEIVTTINTSESILSNALNFTKSGGGAAFGESDKTALVQIDFTGKELGLYIYIKDAATLAKLAEVDCFTIRYGSDNGNYYQWTKDRADFTAEQWNFIGGLDTDNEDSTTGAPVIADMDYVLVGFTATGAAIVWGAGDVIVDHIFALSEKDWKLATNATPSPIGMYDGGSVVVLKGYMDSLSNLIPGQFYWMKADGSLTISKGESYIHTKIGYAISDTEFLVDIDVEGNATSQTITAGRGGNIKGYVMGGHVGAGASDTVEDLTFADEQLGAIVGTLSGVLRYQCDPTLCNDYASYGGGGNDAGADLTAIQEFVFSTEAGADVGAGLTTGKQMSTGVTAVTKGYDCGGTDGGAAKTWIDDFVFATKVSSRNANTLQYARDTMVGLSHTGLVAYLCGGTWSGAATNKTEEFTYATETAATHTVLIEAQKSPAGVFGPLAGYILGDETDNQIGKVVFSSGTVSQLAEVIVPARYSGVGISSMVKGYVVGGSTGAASKVVDELLFATDIQDVLLDELDVARMWAAGGQY